MADALPDSESYIRLPLELVAKTSSIMIARIRARVCGATPPPWTAAPIVSERPWAKVYADGLKQCVADTNGPNAEGDAEFMAHARTDIPWLLALFSAERYAGLSLIDWLKMAAVERSGTEEAVNLLRCAAWLEKAEAAGVKPDPFDIIGDTGSSSSKVKHDEA